MNKLKNKIGLFLAALLLILVGAVESAHAELTTYYFTGKITSVPNSPPYGLILSIGDSVSGSIAYDPSLPPTYDAGNLAGYIQQPPSGMSVVIGGATIQSMGNASLQVLSDWDNFNGYFTPISVNGQQQSSGSHAMSFSLTDTSQTVFSSIDLPLSLNVDSFNTRQGAIFAGSGITVEFSIDTLSLTPTSPAIQIKIDIKPGSFPNSINVKNKGLIPVAILTSDPADNVATFDAATVDATKVRFGPTGTEAAPVHDALEDVDGDGDTDMILHFKTQEVGIKCGDTSATLNGESFDGQAIKGTDTIRTVECN